MVVRVCVHVFVVGIMHTRMHMLNISAYFIPIYLGSISIHLDENIFILLWNEHCHPLGRGSMGFI
jgi:hypothetical protein